MELARLGANVGQDALDLLRMNNPPDEGQQIKTTIRQAATAYKTGVIAELEKPDRVSQGKVPELILSYLFPKEPSDQSNGPQVPLQNLGPGF